MKRKLNRILDNQYEELLEYCKEGIVYILDQNPETNVILIDRFGSMKSLFFKKGILYFDVNPLSDGSGNYESSRGLKKLYVKDLSLKHIQREELYRVAKTIDKIIDELSN